jgi:undecaprenyl pyrophosphate phosphatase UppP
LSWIATTAFSIIIAFIIATWIVNEISDFFGRFSFGIFLLLRWYISMFIGALPATSEAEIMLSGKDID